MTFKMQVDFKIERLNEFGSMVYNWNKKKWYAQFKTMFHLQEFRKFIKMPPFA